VVAGAVDADPRTFPGLPADADVWADVYQVTVAGGTVLRLLSTVSLGLVAK
jgi:hypothetical protein